MEALRQVCHCCVVLVSWPIRARVSGVPGKQAHEACMKIHKISVQ